MTERAAGNVLVAEQVPRAVSQKLSEPRTHGNLADTIYSLAFPLCRRMAGVNPLIGYYHVIRDREVAHVKEL